MRKGVGREEFKLRKRLRALTRVGVVWVWVWVWSWVWVRVGRAAAEVL